MGVKLLVATFTFPPEANGVSAVAAAHALGLAKLGYDVTVATGRAPARSSRSAPEGVRVVEFDVADHARKPLKGPSGDLAAYRRFLATCDADVILCHCWQSWSTDLALPLFQQLRAKKVMVSHGVSANRIQSRSLRGLAKWLAWRPYLWKLPQMLRSFDHVVFLTAMARRDTFYDKRVAGRLGLGNWSIIPNGVYPDRFSDPGLDFRVRFGLDQSPLLLCVANYSAAKNHALALRAFIRAEQRNAVLVFIGSELNSYALGLKQLYESFGSRAGKVMFLEKQPKEVIVAAYRAAEIFLNPSQGEAQPLVVLDAMASDTPFISTDVGCVSELPGGVIVHSESEMARAITDLLNNPEQRRVLAQAGRAAILDRYNWNSTVAAYHALIQRLVDQPRGNVP